MTWSQAFTEEKATIQYGEKKIVLKWCVVCELVGCSNVASKEKGISVNRLSINNEREEKHGGKWVQCTRSKVKWLVRYPKHTYICSEHLLNNTQD